MTHSRGEGEVAREAKIVAGVLRYGKEVTLRDVERLDDFLKNQTNRLAQADRGSDERKLARSVRNTLQHHVVTLQHCFSMAEVDPGPQELVRWKVMLSWNSLCSLVSPWWGHEEYDQERWSTVKRWEASR